MARPIAFDRSRAMNRALALFWRKGYQAATLSDLLSSMEISRSSFYAAFKNKRGLFIECMDMFASRTLAMLDSARAEMAPLDALHHFFERSVVAARGAHTRWGCMLVNTVLELSDVDDELAARANQHLVQMQRVFQSYLRDAGATPARARDLAAMLMLFNEGIRVSSRRGLPETQHLLPIDTTFRLIRSAVA